MSTLSHHESSGTSSLLDEGWVSWFCGLNGNHVFCEVEKQFMEDSFNLFGLRQYVPKDFTKVLSTILDQIDPEDADTEELSKAAAFMYGLIHARYIVSANGLSSMRKKFLMKEFGECPRTYCNGQPVLPVGQYDEPRTASYSLFCPRCRDLYNCHPSQRHIDGAFFGSTFPHIFLMTYEELVPKPPVATYVPRLFGFRIHQSSSSLPHGDIKLRAVDKSYVMGGTGAEGVTRMEEVQYQLQQQQHQQFVQQYEHQRHLIHQHQMQELQQYEQHMQQQHSHEYQQQHQLSVPALDQQTATAAVIEAVAAGAVAGVASAANFIAAASDAVGSGHRGAGTSALYDLIHARSAAAAAAAVAVEATSCARSGGSSAGATSVPSNAGLPTATGSKAFMSTVPANENDGAEDSDVGLSSSAMSLLEEHRRFMQRNASAAKPQQQQQQQEQQQQQLDGAADTNAKEEWAHRRFVSSSNDALTSANVAAAAAAEADSTSVATGESAAVIGKSAAAVADGDADGHRNGRGRKAIELHEDEDVEDEQQQQQQLKKRQRK